MRAFVRAWVYEFVPVAYTNWVLFQDHMQCIIKLCAIIIIKLYDVIAITVLIFLHIFIASTLVKQ